MRRISAAMTAALLLASVPAAAGGGGVIRDLSRTTLRSCPAGYKLKEHYFVASNVESYAEDIEIACLRDPRFATWLFTAESDCENNQLCLSIEKQLAYPREHNDLRRPDEAYASPRVVTYRTARYKIGERCTLRGSKDGDEPDFYWSCATYRSIRTRRPIRVEAVGATTSLDDIARDAPRLPLVVFIGDEKPPTAR